MYSRVKKGQLGWVTWKLNRNELAFYHLDVYMHNERNG
jgi:hypothetical protein